MTAELKAKRTFADISKMYSEDKAQEKLNALVLGTYGSGKTTLAATCPSPVLIHSFDPGGTKGLKAEIEAGKIFVDTRFEHDDTKTKSAAQRMNFDILRADATRQSGSRFTDSDRLERIVIE